MALVGGVTSEPTGGKFVTGLLLVCFSLFLYDMHKDYLKPKDISMRVARLTRKQVRQWTDIKAPDFIKTFQLYLTSSDSEIGIYKMNLHEQFRKYYHANIIGVYYAK